MWGLVDYGGSGRWFSISVWLIFSLYICNIRSAIYWFHQAKLIENGHSLFSYNAILGVLVRANMISLAKAFYAQVMVVTLRSEEERKKYENIT